MEDSEDFRDRNWYFPFLLLVILPVVTVPVTKVFAGVLGSSGECFNIGNPNTNWLGTFVCPKDKMVLLLAPGVLNLVPALWLLAASKRARRVGAIATGIGALRLGLPVWGVASGGVLVGDGFGGFFLLWDLWWWSVPGWIAPPVLLAWSLTKK